MRIYLLLLSAFLSLNAIGQSTGLKMLKAAEKFEIDELQPKEGLDKEKMIRHIYVDMPYAEYNIINENILDEIRSGKVLEVNLYYTDYPKGANLNELNSNRFEQLLSQDSLFLDSSIRWTVNRQMKCRNMAEANEMFHGFEIVLDLSKSRDLAFYHLVRGTKDLVVEEVLKRNDWDSMLVVADFTGSMGAYVSQVLLWLKLNIGADRINQFVFFNDGNGRSDKYKQIGRTGGIHQTKSKIYKEVETLAKLCRAMGGGGDIQENDIEALLAGCKLCPECSEVVLIADNKAPVRDMKLLNQLDRPVHVILCGFETVINPEYLNIARQTGGTVHTIEYDLDNLFEMNEGQIFSFKGEKYMVKDGAFIHLENQ